VSLWDALVGRRSVKLSLTDAAQMRLGFGLGSKSGQTVTPESTLQLSAAWACIRLKSRVVGALPLQVYKRGAKGERTVATDHWLYDLLHNSPNAEQTPMEYIAGQIGCLDLRGNGYSLKDMSGQRVTTTTPLNPDLMEVKRDTANGVRLYRYADRGGTQTYSEQEIVHLRGFTLGGDVGLSAVAYGRHSLGTAMAADETAAKTFANGLQLSGFVQMDKGVRLDTQQRKDLLELFDRFTGSSRAGKVMPLDGGMSFQPLSMNPEDAQLLQSRGFNIEEVCRWFDTPPMLIGHASQGQTMWGTGYEQNMIAWLTTGLDPLLTSLEQAFAKQLLSPVERQTYYVEFNRQGLLRADSVARGEFYSKIFQMAGITPNQIADRENLPRFEGGDQRYVNATFVPAELAGQVRTQPAPGDVVRS
jgi:HK97 family phage portal protein